MLVTRLPTACSGHKVHAGPFLAPPNHPCYISVEGLSRASFICNVLTIAPLMMFVRVRKRHSMHLCGDGPQQVLNGWILGVRGLSSLPSCSACLNSYLGPLAGAAEWESPWQASAQAILIVPERTAH